MSRRIPSDSAPRDLSPNAGALKSVSGAPIPSGTVETTSLYGPPRLTEKQLAERWNISVRTLQAARVKGLGVPFVRIGRSVRYRLEDVLSYERDRLRTDTSTERHRPDEPA